MHKIFTLPAGDHLAFRESGAGRALVLVHGWGVTGDVFGPTLEALSPRYRVLVPDLRGHGASSTFTVGQRFSQLADDLGAFLTATADRDTVLVGWSMGALVAWDLLAREQPLPVAGLVIVDMVPKLLNDEDWHFGLRAGPDAGVFAAAMAAMGRDWRSFTRVFIPRVLAADGDPDQRAALIAWLCRLAEDNDGTVMARLWAEMVAQDLRPALPGIDLPALVIHGARSQLYGPDAARWLAGQMPRAIRATCPEAGHAPHLERPGWFRETLVDFIDAVGRDGWSGTTTMTGGSRSATN